MYIDTDHLHYWMQAIRMSSDPIRTMDAFYGGQIKSKEWLIDNLKNYVKEPMTIDIHGGWVGVLASLMFQSDLPIKKIRSVDIDPTCEPIARMMNRGEEIMGRFEAVTRNMCVCLSDYDVIVNTSCEHITQEDYELWLEQLPKNSIIVLQSNNYEIQEHIRTAKNLDDFVNQSHLKTVFCKKELTLQLYDRYMIIGKNV